MPLLSPDPADEEAYVALPRGAGRAQLRRAGGGLADARRAARRCWRATPRGSPATQLPGSRLGRARAAAAQAPPVRGRRASVGVRRAADVRPDERGEAADAAAPSCATRPSSSRPIGIAFKRRFGRPVIVCQTPDELLAAWAPRGRLRRRCCRRWCPATTTRCGRSAPTPTPPAARSGSSAAASWCRCRAASAPAASARRAGATTPSSRRWRCSRALGYHGIAQTEFRLDPRDGRSS